MPQDAIQVDTAMLDQLIESNRQQAVLDEFRRRAEENKDKVDDAVYRRVLEDYTARLEALNAQTAPMRAAVRAEFETVRKAYEALGQAIERARLEKQELEFRSQIGELDPAQLAVRLAAPMQALEDGRQGLLRLDAQKARFVEAFGSEEALTGLVTHRTGPGQPADPPGVTPRGGLRVEGEGTDAADYVLGTLARIGRAEDNDICVQSRGISRHHAVITANLQGFLLRDLGSQNGTVVNGERIAERQLADGDQIALGDARLRFTLLRGTTAAR